MHDADHSCRDNQEVESTALPQANGRKVICTSRSALERSIAPIRDFLVERPCPGDGIRLNPSSTAAELSFDEAALPQQPGESCPEQPGSGQGEPGSSSAGGRSGSAEDAFFWVPDNVIEHWGEVLDIVEPDSQRSNCFTKTYSRYTKVAQLL